MTDKIIGSGLLIWAPMEVISRPIEGQPRRGQSANRQYCYDMYIDHMHARDLLGKLLAPPSAYHITGYDSYLEGA